MRVKEFSLRLVMFDLDGTLVDSVPDLAAAVDSMLLSLGREAAGVDQVRQWVGNGAAMLVQRALTGSMQPPEIPHELFQSAYEHFLNAYRSENGKQSRLYPGVADTLSFITEQVEHIAVITNKPAQFTQVLLDQFDIPQFDLVLSGDSLSEKKPHPLPLQHCMNTFLCKPDEVLMVGDSVSDVRAAQAAKAPVACVTYGYHQGVDLRALQADYLLDNFTALKRIVTECA